MFPEQILIRKWVISINYIQCSLRNAFMVDTTTPGWNRGLDALCCIDIDVTPAQYLTIIAFTSTSWLLLCHNVIIFCWKKIYVYVKLFVYKISSHEINNLGSMKYSLHNVHAFFGAFFRSNVYGIPFKKNDKKIGRYPREFLWKVFCLVRRLENSTVEIVRY